MATQKVSSNYANARKGKPPTGPVRDAHKAGQTPGFRNTEHLDRLFAHSDRVNASRRAPEVHHTARKAASTVVKTAVPETRAVKLSSLKLPAVPKGLHSDKRTASPFRHASNHAPVLVAEFIVALLIIGITTATSNAKSTYHEAAATAMLQGSAVCVVFFLLFLLAAGKRGSEAAAWFGALIDLGILFNAVNQEAIANFALLVQGQGLPTPATLVSQKNVPEYYGTSSTWTDVTAPAPTSSGVNSSSSGSNTAELL